MRSLALAVVLALTAASTAPAAPPTVQVMVLGSYHFGNPGMDIVNTKVDSVLTPQRQQELARVAKALLAFKPTHVMVEAQSDAPDFALASYGRFTDAALAKEANETVQIGFRIARLAGLTTVNGIDEQNKDDEPDYFPYDKVQAAATKFGQSAQLDALNAPVVASSKAFEAVQASSSVAQLLMRINDPASLYGNMDGLYGLLTIGDKDNQAGADLNAMWYLRNAKIFGKLMQVAKPGARVLVVYGGGHLFWLKHFARFAPGFRDVDVMPYLQRAR